MNSPSKLPISYTVTRGKNSGLVLSPHMRSDGAYTLSKTRFEEDYLYVYEPEEALKYLNSGYKIRMSAPGHAPSLISKASINLM